MLDDAIGVRVQRSMLVHSGTFQALQRPCIKAVSISKGMIKLSVFTHNYFLNIGKMGSMRAVAFVSL